MESKNNKIIWTIGHSTRSLDEFLNLLSSVGITQLVDVRSFPGSRKFPQFNKDNLATSLPKHDIKYIHLKSLGGRRKAKPESQNKVWRHPSFRGYADYMETSAFKEALEDLKNLARQNNTAIMCAEAVWWRCHRSMVSDVLKAEGWKVMHIMGENNVQEHPYTKPAKIISGELYYQEEKE
ncbi:Protein of unknown function, DUF488 [Salegentibacter echinorum]|uniref:Fe-S cluster assembly protein HesB n=1 Tax=Salegentibacter echinorum TaxID=1073325 RepID=A0A1M5JL93_SALEC|nr:DUF488 domain-containing protein [Salegentibacter echinorum]SHG41040.1 Protein of unknown function, DUF488 [Salegentibacter echinorum]